MSDDQDCHPDAKIIWDLFQRPSPAVGFWELDALVDTLLSPLTNDLSSTPAGGSRAVFIEEIWQLFQRQRPYPDITELDEIVSCAIPLEVNNIGFEIERVPVTAKSRSVPKGSQIISPRPKCCGFPMNRRKSETSQDSCGNTYRITLWRCGVCDATKSVAKTF